MTNKISIALPTLIHRIGGEKAKQAKEMAAQCHCELRRVRRSRNWALLGEAMQVQSFVERLKAQSHDGFRYLIQKIATGLLEHSDKLEPIAVKLARLIEANPNITLGELILATECTMAEARLARFYDDTWD